jgi:dolichyl-phosphate-mannose--protein O-mannosyl transferase
MVLPRPYYLYINIDFSMHTFIGFKSASCELGEPIQCGQKIRLEHIGTGKQLHSHLFKSPLSGNQEVSGFGVEGSGDTGDDWVLECEAGLPVWNRGQAISLRHADTGKVLVSSKASAFNQQNCGQQCPIMGQLEVSAANQIDKKAYWLTTQGVYFPPKDAPKSTKNDEDDEDDEL